MVVRLRKEKLTPPLVDAARKRAFKVCDALKKNGIEASFFDETDDAVEKITSMIPDNATVGLGGSTTLIESGLIDRLRSGNCNLLDRYAEGLSKSDMAEMRNKSMTCDVFLASANAVTIDGRLVNCDGTGSRVAAITYGPKKVIIFAGINKIVSNLEEAFSRIANLAAPANAIRLDRDLPCAKDGLCDRESCPPDGTICNHYLVTTGNGIPGRLSVVFTSEELGF